MARKFTTDAPRNPRWSSGYAAGELNPSRWADELFGASIPGPWLLAYMIRRFGWPNHGSDPHKELCTWVLTTRIEGLYLTVTPYMGHQGGELKEYGCSNLHFGVLFTKEVREQVERDPRREAFWRRKERAIRRWWDKSGSDLYVFGWGTDDGGEDDEIVQEYGRKDGKIWGLWKRPARIKTRQPFVKNPDGMLIWWLCEHVPRLHPEMKLPEPNARERKRTPTAIQRRARAAIEATLRDLLRPVYVRDIGISPFGDIERTPAATARCEGQTTVERFAGAGYAPEYWFKKGRREAQRVG